MRQEPVNRGRPGSSYTQDAVPRPADRTHVPAPKDLLLAHDDEASWRVPLAGFSAVWPRLEPTGNNRRESKVEFDRRKFAERGFDN